MKATGLAKTAGAVVGENLARIREDRRQTQREAAAFLRERGMAMSPANVAQLELGRRASIGIAELLQLSDAYEVPLHEWFAGEGSVYLSDQVRLWREDVRKALRGKSFGVLLGSAQRQTRYMTDEPERAAANQLGLPVADVAALGLHTWGRTLTAERDARLGDLTRESMRSVQAKRGHVTRALIQELRQALEGNKR
jgi:transcriptional regulator with XRE-family HTH domain